MVLRVTRFYSGSVAAGARPTGLSLADAACLQSSCWTLHVRLIRTRAAVCTSPALAATDGWLSSARGAPGAQATCEEGRSRPTCFWS